MKKRMPAPKLAEKTFSSFVSHLPGPGEKINFIVCQPAVQKGAFAIQRLVYQVGVPHVLLLGKPFGRHIKFVFQRAFEILVLIEHISQAGYFPGPTFIHMPGVSDAYGIDTVEIIIGDITDGQIDFVAFMENPVLNGIDFFVLIDVVTEGGMAANNTDDDR